MSSDQNRDLKGNLPKILVTNAVKEHREIKSRKKRSRRRDLTPETEMDMVLDSKGSGLRDFVTLLLLS